ncbi:COG1470 family protein [Lacinutrix chionoecetis]
MSQERDNIAKDFESIVKKTIEINSQYLKQGANLVSDLSNSRSQKKTINPFQPDLMVGAFTAFTKLNLDHYKNMVDLGFELSKKLINSNQEPSNGNESNTQDNKNTAAFVLTETVVAGNTAILQFVLDNTKKEEAVCTLKNEDFINVDNSSVQNFKTTFTPQSFSLKPAESQTIKIEVKIGAKVKPGDYQSKVQVLGFEPAHFLVHLSVQKKPTKPKKPTKNSANGQ